MDAIPPVPQRPLSAVRNRDPTKRHTFHPDSALQRSSTNFRTRSANRVTVQPASTEVLHSLITSLSAISSPAETYFDSHFPLASTRSAPTSPVVGTFKDGIGRSPLNPGTLGDSESNKDMVSNGFLHPDDAAISPVIRTAKPPSGFSPLTAPKKQRSHSSSPQLGRLSGTFDHFVSPTIGKLSIEPGLSRASNSSLKSEGSGKAKSQKSLNIKSSKEKMREMDKERKRKSSKGSLFDGTRSPIKIFKDGIEQPMGSPRSPIKVFKDGAEQTVPGTTLVELPESPEDSTDPKSTSSPERKKDGTIASSNEPGTEPEVPGQTVVVRRVPDRESSLRHSTGSTASRRNRKSYRHNHFPAEIHVEKPREEAKAEYERILPSPTADDSVTRRIRELKAQKEEREKSWYSDDEGQREAAKDRETAKDVPPGRSSLPAPSTKSDPDLHAGGDKTDHDPDVTSKFIPLPMPTAEERTQAIQRRKSLSAQNPAHRMTAPAHVFDKHNRTFSNPLSAPRKSMHVEDRPSSADSIDKSVKEYLTAPRLSQIIYHPQTGRAISFSEVGDPNGSVVFCCVGMGTTRFLTAFYDELAMTLNLRLITPDRPGIGDSESCPDGQDTPLAWPDDIRAICQHLHISRFSILAHSAGSIYALATALRMPQHIRGRIHLLAPWIPPSQMVAIGISQDPVPVTTLPYSQRILRSLPTPFLKAANSSFFSITSTSITTSIQKSPKRTKRRSLNADTFEQSTDQTNIPVTSTKHTSYTVSSDGEQKSPGLGAAAAEPELAAAGKANLSRLSGKERQTEYDMRLTQGIWEAATTNANPAVDLLVCLERRQEIGFRYVDINKSVVIHHGTRDSRVPLENVKWLSKTMRNCEIRVLEGEGHGLMASAAVMGSVLSEMAKEWEDWIAVTRRGRSENKKMHG